jgi:histidyl-tRNA synthetase
MEKRGLSKNSVEFVLSCLDIKTLDELEAKIGHTEVGKKGIRELKTFHSYADMHTFDKCELVFDITLARGLSYYTGCVFEVKANGVAIGSIGGGGRYDNLTGSFGLKGVSGVGVSFGAARIYLVMEELGLFPEALTNNMELLIMALDDESHLHAYGLLNDLRQKGIVADLYPEAAKMKKMMKYANNISAPYVIIIGESERESGNYKVKNMETGEQIDFKNWLSDK